MRAVGHHNIPLENIIRTQLKILLAFLNNNYHEINPVIKSCQKRRQKSARKDFVQVFILLTLSKFSMLIWCVWLTFNSLNLLTVFSCGTISLKLTWGLFPNVLLHIEVSTAKEHLFGRKIGENKLNCVSQRLVISLNRYLLQIICIWNDH